MKILVTGNTQLHCTPDHYLTQQLKVVPSETALVGILKELGHEVVQKPITWGEDLDSFDKVLVYYGPTDSFVPGFSDGLFWVLHNRPDCGALIDDYQCSRILMDKLEAKWKEAFVDQMNGVDNRELIDSIHTDWMKNKKILVPAFYGGDLSLLFSKAKKKAPEWFEQQNLDVFRYYPDPWLPGRGPTSPFEGERKFEWVVAGLSKQNRQAMNKWKPTLPVIELGGRGENGVRMPEPEALEWFGERWFHCMPSYDHKGSGWWRSRPIQLANSGVVTYGHPDECKLYGESWVIKDPLILEKESPHASRTRAENQREDFFASQPQDKGKPAEDVELFLNAL